MVGNYYVNWIAATQPYIKSWQLFKCPSTSLSTVASRVSFGNSENTYQANEVVMGRSIAVIPNASEIIWTQEVSNFSNTAWLRPHVKLPIASPPRYSEWMNISTYSANHFDGGNLLFCDGHVKFRKRDGIRATEFGINDPTVGFKTGVTDNTGPGAEALF